MEKSVQKRFKNGWSNTHLKCEGKLVGQKEQSSSTFYISLATFKKKYNSKRVSSHI